MGFLLPLNSDLNYPNVKSFGYSLSNIILAPIKLLVRWSFFLSIASIDWFAIFRSLIYHKSAIIVAAMSYYSVVIGWLSSPFSIFKYNKIRKMY